MEQGYSRRGHEDSRTLAGLPHYAPAMVELTRTVRFCVNEPGDEPAEGHNTFAGHPSMRGLGRFYELEVRCRGEVDGQTGYFVNIKTIDQAVRSTGVPIIAKACHERPWSDPATVLPLAAAAIDGALGGCVHEVRWRLSPYYSVAMSPKSAATALLRQQFDLAASHRLHIPALSEDENRQMFGKCNNPSGHGHNYRVEPCVRVRLGDSGARFTLADLERVTDRVIVNPFDHKHFNSDTTEFAIGQPGAVNPSVENIARVFFDRLAPAIRSMNADAELVCLTVWETDKTSCTYPGQSA